jgi:hypothetical protein
MIMGIMMWVSVIKMWVSVSVYVCVASDIVVDVRVI